MILRVSNGGTLKFHYDEDLAMFLLNGNGSAPWYTVTSWQLLGPDGSAI